MDKAAAGNMESVRAALHGITGVEQKPEVIGPDRYVVMSRMNHELDTVDSLRRNHFAAFYPSYQHLVTTRQKINGRYVRKLVRVGIIPGYVFSAVDPNRDFLGMLDKIVGAIEVARTFSGNPLLITDADVQILKRIEAGLNTPRPEKVLHTFAKGHKVRFIDDLIGRWPYGIVGKLYNDGRISVEVDLMGRKVPITVLPHQIERT